MSIYASWLDIDDDGHDVTCAVYERMPDGQSWKDGATMVAGDVFYRRGGKPCTCENRPPIIYQGSHVNPGDDDPRGGSVDIAAVPNHCHPSVSDQPEIIVTITGAGPYTDGRYRVWEVEHDSSDSDNPALKIWLDPDQPKEAL